VKRFAVNGTDKIEENEFGAFCLWAEARLQIQASENRLEFEQTAREHDLEAAVAIEKRMKDALEEIIRNVELWRKADNMAGRVCKIAEEGLGR